MVSKTSGRGTFLAPRELWPDEARPYWDAFPRGSVIKKLQESVAVLKRVPVPPSNVRDKVQTYVLGLTRPVVGGIALDEALTVQWPTGLHALMAFHNRLCGHFSPSQRRRSHHTRRNDVIQEGGAGRRLTFDPGGSLQTGLPTVGRSKDAMS
jgi:hypothetical protein